MLVPVSREFLLGMHWTELGIDADVPVSEISPGEVNQYITYMCTASGGRTVFCNPLDTPRVEDHLVSHNQQA